MNKSMKGLCALCLGLAYLLLGSSPSQAAMHEFYVGVDGLSAFTSGTYGGLTNPNHGRLTLLFAHWNDGNPSSNHYHGIGAYSYAGTPPMHVTNPTNGNNRIPETFTGQAPLTLKPGSGIYAGKWISGENGEHYSDLSLYSVHDLTGFGPTAPETYMFNSSGERWNGTLAGLDLELELVSISPGLHLGTASDPDAITLPGQRIHIGGPGSLPFEPVFWTEGAASIGAYSAELRLHDRSGAFQNSGTFNFDFAKTVPEPGTMTLVIVTAIGTVVTGVYRRKR